MDLALNNPQRLICHEIKPNQSFAGERSRGRPESSLFNSYYTEVLEGATPFPGLLYFALDPYLYNAEC